MDEVSGQGPSSHVPEPSDGNTNQCNHGLDSNDVEKCPVHPGRRIEAYCPDDGTLGCLLCFTDGHKSCRNVTLVSDEACRIESSKDFLDLQKAVDIYNSLEMEYKRAIEKCRSFNDECRTKTLENFQRFRSDIFGMVDQIGVKISDEAEKLRKENESKLNSLAKTIDTYSEQVRSAMAEIKEKQETKQRIQLFVDLKKHVKHVIHTKDRLQKLQQDIEIKKFDFLVDSNIIDMIKTSSKISIVSTACPSVYCTQVESRSNIQKPSLIPINWKAASKVDIGTRKDCSECFVSAIMEISATRLIFVDWSNYSLKMVDRVSNKFIDRRVLTSKPWDITKIPGSRVAVTFPETQHILFYTYNLKLCGCIALTGQGWGVFCVDDRLFVSFSRPLAQVQILDLSGMVYQSIQPISQGSALLENPMNLTYDQDTRKLYVSDADKHTVTCMSIDGVVQWVYQSQELQVPTGIVCGDFGCIYICSRANDTIHVVSAGGYKLAIIPMSQSGVHAPQAVWYRSHDRTLYVSSGRGDREHRNKIKRLCLQ